MGLVLVVFLIYVYVPLARRTMQEGAQLGEVRQRLQEAQATVSSFGGYKQTNARLKDRLEDFRKSRVSDKEYSELLGVLIAAGKKTGAEVISVRPLRAKSRENYEELPVEVTLRTRHQGLETFLRELETSNLLVKVLKITASTEKTTPPEIEVTFKGVAFFVR
jgi:Tfp pilus assembly protein PilO